MPPRSKQLPQCRESITLKNAVGELEFYVTVGFYDDQPRRPGEVFIHLAKEGSTLGGVTQALALAISQGFHYGVPWRDFRKHMFYSSFAPSGPSLDGSVVYPSLTHAIAHTVDMILERRAREEPVVTRQQSVPEPLDLPGVRYDDDHESGSDAPQPA